MDFSEIEQKILKVVYEKQPDSNETPKKHRVILVYNPRSSKAARVKAEILEPLRKIPGILVGKYEVRPTDVDDNALELSEILEDGDIVLTAGGDGTSTIGLNGALLSKKDVRFFALPYGNFNDLPRTVAEASGKEIYPLEAIVDNKHYRYALCYFTIGMFAESTEIFDAEETRKELRKGNKGLFFSLKTLVKWYFKNRKREFIPNFSFSSTTKTYDKNGVFTIREKILRFWETEGISDYLAVNGLTAARLMKGGKFYESKTDFLSTTGKLTKLFKLSKFMISSVLKRVPADISTEDILIFPDYADVEIQAEGEYKKLEHVGKILIRKSDVGLKIL